MKTQLLLAISQTLLICVLITLTFVNGILINRKRTGVIFSPYVDRNTNISYAEEDIRLMLKLVATKFSMIATYGDATDEHFFPKRFHKTAAKVAAKINAESKQPLLKVLLGIRVYNENRVSIFNAAKKANKIYNGTVVALVVHHSDIGNERSSCATQQAVNIVKKVKKEAHTIGLKVGIRHMHNCLSTQNKLLREMAKECDFIVCHIEPPTQILKSRSEEAFGYVGTDLLSKRDYFKEINPSIEVMGETGFPSQGFQFDTWHNVRNMKIYWKSANKWASQNNFTMWMFEAFDNPWRVNRANGWYPLSGNSGWWKLRRNRYVGMPDAFVEKISESPSELLEKVDEYSMKNKNNFEITKSPPIWVEVGTILAGLLVIAFVTNFVLLKLKIKRLKGKLSKADLDEFINGISEDSNKEVENAVKFPYDKSYEIPKDSLKIR
ncbi:unnamed protein product [Orchesella dallaii]|uniref:glucan endo-1,3-beta-D-glucosidase n=1 Tax=Orchesella dallaii TaxID=48710 RepID=A0ABP1RY90_9HEXA